jgi:dihydropteroate synthase
MAAQPRCDNWLPHVRANRASIAALPRQRTFRLRTPNRTIVLGERTLVMGVLNVTPDSFSDGGKYFSARAAVARGLALQAAGADMIDIGGESTRPGSKGVTAEEEMRRILPVITQLAEKLKIPISVDTSKAVVAEAAVLAGAELINDVTGLQNDKRVAEVAARLKVPLIVMHMRGTPATMQKMGFARDAMRDVKKGLKQSVRLARKAGVPKSQIMIDPGIGFGKKAVQNMELIGGLSGLAKLGFPVLAGTSRKSFVGKLLGGAPAHERKWGTAATVTASVLGGAHIVRVHDVEEMTQVVRVADAIRTPALFDALVAEAHARR